MSSRGRGNLRFKPPFKPVPQQEPKGNEPMAKVPRLEPINMQNCVNSELKSILRKKGRGKKSNKVTQTKKLTWRPQSELAQIQHFELIEGERINVKPDVVLHSNESSRILRSKSKPIEQDKSYEICEQDEQDSEQDSEQDEQDEFYDEDDQYEQEDSDIDGDLEEKISSESDSDEDINEYEQNRLNNLAEMRENEFFNKVKNHEFWNQKSPKTKAAKIRPAKGQLISEGLFAVFICTKN